MSFGIESANIVGYANTGLNATGNTAMGACFVNVSGVDMTMKDVKITGYGNEGYADGMIVASKLTPGGTTAASFTWIDISDPDAGEFYGWYNEDGSEDYNAVPLEPGEALWIQGAGMTLVSAGQVPSAGIAVVLNNVGNKLVANPMPITLKMGDVKIAGYGDHGYADGMIVASKLTSGGTTAASYVWIDFADPEVGKFYGWYNEDGSEDYNNAPLAAGEALWVQSPEFYSMVFPSPFEK